MPELHLNTSATSMSITNGQDRKTLNLFKFISQIISNLTDYVVKQKHLQLYSLCYKLLKVKDPPLSKYSTQY
jgi:hypothetical protein